MRVYHVSRGPHSPNPSSDCRTEKSPKMEENNGHTAKAKSGSGNKNAAAQTKFRCLSTCATERSGEGGRAGPSGLGLGDSLELTLGLSDAAGMGLGIGNISKAHDQQPVNKGDVRAR